MHGTTSIINMLIFFLSLFFAPLFFPAIPCYSCQFLHILSNLCLSCVVVVGYTLVWTTLEIELNYILNLKQIYPSNSLINVPWIPKCEAPLLIPQYVFFFFFRYYHVVYSSFTCFVYFMLVMCSCRWLNINFDNVKN